MSTWNHAIVSSRFPTGTKIQSGRDRQNLIREEALKWKRSNKLRGDLANDVQDERHFQSLWLTKEMVVLDAVKRRCFI